MPAVRSMAIRVLRALVPAIAIIGYAAYSNPLAVAGVTYQTCFLAANPCSWCYPGSTRDCRMKSAYQWGFCQDPPTRWCAQSGIGCIDTDPWDCANPPNHLTGGCAGGTYQACKYQ